MLIGTFGRANYVIGKKSTESMRAAIFQTIRKASMGSLNSFSEHPRHRL
jgi:hypothetical protein